MWINKVVVFDQLGVNVPSKEVEKSANVFGWEPSSLACVALRWRCTPSLC